ncbi:MAG TPA: class I SAM-dependent methyltransferase [Lacunisphaera sp.]|nr:class I SAM-dependent methyltransferase [Lacunisphaera sp.]
MDRNVVVNCYDLLSLTPAAGIEDYTEGIYGGRRATPYAEAQRRQHDWLLDELGVGPGFRLLDVGCGTGSVLPRASARGAVATGITISPAQVKLGRSRGLDVRLLDYRDMDRCLAPEYDGIIANGSIEHFCPAEEAAAGRQDAIYRRMFELFHRVLRPDSPARRVVSTTIHFRGLPPAPARLLRSPFRALASPAVFHFGILERGYGGYYPVAGQLARCAAPLFRLVQEQDGTEDYGFTSEDWRQLLVAALRRRTGLGTGIMRCFLRRPRHTAYMLMSFFGPQSWRWQFRGHPPPTTLWRQTWQAA